MVSRYLELKSKAYTNCADAEEADRKLLALLVEKPVPTGDELKKKQDALDKERSTSSTEFERLDTEAENLHDDNKGKYNSAGRSMMHPGREIQPKSSPKTKIIK